MSRQTTERHQQQARLLGDEPRPSIDSLAEQDHDTSCHYDGDKGQRLRTAGSPGHRASSRSPSAGHGDPELPPYDSNDDELELQEMDSNARRPEFLRPTGGRSGTPLLHKEVDPERGRSSADDGDDDDVHYDPHVLQRPALTRQSTMRSRSPREVAAAQATKKKYIYASCFLMVSLVSFCVQTELSAYIQHDLGWDKAYCMMYFTHGSWIVLYPVQLLVLRLQKLDEPWSVFWKHHLKQLRSTALMVETRTLDVFRPSVERRGRPIWYMIRYTAIITSALTVAGLSWYVAVSLTTPSDLTAIYNCSAFFAYVFSVPLLKEPLRLDKSIAVLIAIAGVLIVAYGDTKPEESDAPGPDGSTTTTGGRFFGNIVIGIGSVLYGLYEVLYKRFACPPEGVSPGRGVIFANTFGACIGLFTLTVLWIPLPILDVVGIEKYEIPEASTCWLILAAVLANATFSGSFLVLISLTSPVLSSVAALLTIFIVALADFFITGEPLSPAALFGGCMIIVAFLGLSWSTYREMTEHEAQKMAVDLTDSDSDDDEPS